jgi:hypothetical protein
MRRPRWHDALIALGILGIAGSGVWAFWGDDVARALGFAPAPAVEKAPPAAAS